MSDQLQTAVSWLAGQLAANVAEQVTYTQGGQSVSVAATIGRTRVELEDAMGNVRTQYTDRDYLIQASLLVIGGQTVLPQRGDTVTESDGRVYSVTPLGPTDDVWRWSDPYHTLLRIHAKQTSGVTGGP